MGRPVTCGCNGTSPAAASPALEQPAPVVERDVVLHEAERDRATGLGGEAPHPVELAVGGRQVLALDSGERELEHAAPRLLQGTSMPNSSSSAANVPGTGSPSMARCTIVRDVLTPTAPASIASRTMRVISAMSSLVAGSLRTALTHHVGAHGAVRHLGAHVQRERCRVDCVEELGEGLPAPPDALGQGRAGDVLDAFHQADEPLAPVGRHRRSPRAVAHEHRDPVAAARVEQRVHVT